MTRGGIHIDFLFKISVYHSKNVGLLIAKLSNKEGTKAVKVGNRKSEYYAESEFLFCPLQK